MWYVPCYKLSCLRVLFSKLVATIQTSFIFIYNSIQHNDVTKWGMTFVKQKAKNPSNDNFTVFLRRFSAFYSLIIKSQAIKSWEKSPSHNKQKMLKNSARVWPNRFFISLFQFKIPVYISNYLIWFALFWSLQPTVQILLPLLWLTL